MVTPLKWSSVWSSCLPMTGVDRSETTSSLRGKEARKMNMTDPFGRKINYLRLSVTDRCNLRCKYCMPATGVPKLTHQDILSYEELYQVAGTAVALGVEKIRITGGEPLIRKGLIQFLSQLSGLPGLKELTLTTNGVLLLELAEELKEAGVKRLNISIDSLIADKFSAITRGGKLKDALRGIAAAERVGFAIKLNMVVMRGINDDEIIDLANLTMEKNYTVRFIEYMPSTEQSENSSLAISGKEIIDIVANRHRLIPMTRSALSGPAQNFKIAGAVGSLGIITPMSNHFCADCNRIRVTSTGMLRGCLFAKQEIDLKPALHTGNRCELERAFYQCVNLKNEKHQMTWHEKPQELFRMSRIGG